MKTLIAEDELISRMLLQEILRNYGPYDIAVNGKEAVAAVRMAMEAGEPYELICMDIMMPQMDGQQALREIRAIEESKGIMSSRGAKIVMTTALGDPKTVVEAFKGLCDVYLIKPIDREKLLQELRKLGLI